MRGGDRDWARYQRDVAGLTEVLLNPDNKDTQIWADGLGLDPDAVVAVEAKYVQNPGSGGLYEGGAPPEIEDLLMEQFDNEMARYGAALLDPSSPVQRLRIVTNTDAAAAYLEERARGLLPAGADLQVIVRSPE